MPTPDTMQIHLDEVQGRLAEVYDPELDEPLTKLGFIGAVSIDGGTVEVAFRLPTYFCSANFAFIMAQDIRDRLSELPWVTSVKVNLVDHFVSDEVNSGVNGRRSFCETFPGLAEGELDEVRETFSVKAFVARQERLVRHLVDLGLNDDRIADLTLGDAAMLLKDGADAMGAALLDRYMAIRAQRGLSVELSQQVFTGHDGAPIGAHRFRDYLQSARSVRLNMEFNTALCSGLLKTRYGFVKEEDIA